MFLKRRPRFATPLAQRIDRRKFGQAAGVGLIAAPFVRLLSSEPASAAPGSAKRLMLVVMGGNHPDSARMVGSSDTELVTNNWTDGFDRVKDKIVVVENLNAGPLGHGGGMAVLAHKNRWDGKSIDRIVAEHLEASGEGRAIPSLLLGPDVTDRSVFFDKAPLPVIQNAAAAHNLVFGNFTPPEGGDDGDLAARIAKKQSILDSVRSDLNELNAMLGAQERPKLEAHLDSLRQYEARLSAPAPVGGSCEAPMVVDSTDSVTQAQAQMRLAHATLACDISRVVAVMWGQDNKFDVNLPDINVVTNEHETHHQDIEAYQRLESYKTHQFADFIELMDGTPDPESDGTLLDNTIVCLARTMGDGFNHTSVASHLVFAGGPKILRTTPNGRHIDAQGEPYRRGLSCLANAMGQTDVSAVDGHAPLDGVLV